MRWTVQENQIGPCPALRIEDLPDTLPANIRILHKDGILSVLCENIAGILPCKNGNEILIEPKYPAVDPMDMLLYLHSVSGIAVSRAQVASGKGRVDLATVADAFVAQLRLLGATAKKFQRKPKAAVTHAVVGKVNWIKTLKELEQNSPSIITTIRAATLDIPENALIAAAAQKVAHLYPDSSSEHAILYPWLKLAKQFGHSYRELASFQAQLSESRLGGAHGFYYAPVMLSKIILGFTDGQTVPEETDAILFNMPNLYEEFVRTGFERAGAGFGVTVQKGLVPRGFLFCDGVCELIPDITISAGTTAKAVLDVKYKVPDSKDFHQIYAYMQYMHLREAFLISPEVEQDRSVVAFDGAKVHLLRIDRSDPQELEDRAKKIIRGVL